MRIRVAGLVTMLPLLATQLGCDWGPIEFGPMGPFSTPTREETCLGAYTTWTVQGLAPEQVPEAPDQLLKARLRVGDAADLRVTDTGATCDDLVASVSWQSSAAAVADVAPQGANTGHLSARAPGEAVVWADVTLGGGTTRRAELYAKPAGRTTLLRVYAVTVTR